MKKRIGLKNEKNLEIMLAKKAHVFRVKLRQLRKKYRYVTGGSGRRFFLAFALRQLMRAHGKRGACKKTTKKPNSGWTITVARQAADSLLEEMRGEDVEKEGSVVDLKSTFSTNQEDSGLGIPSGYSCPLAMGLAKLDELDRQHPSSSSTQVFDDSIEGIPLPAVVCSLLIEKHFDQSSCVAIALSGAFPAFSSSYSSTRKRKGLVINEQCFYFTPTTFSTFIDQHISLQTITILNLNNLYWLPAQLLESTIKKMTNVENLSIKGTRVCTVRQVAKILQSCTNIKSLDFTFTEKTEEDINEGLRKESISIDAFTNGFRKLTGLKLSTTTVPDPQYDVFEDPWLPILKILSCCRDCTKLAIEVTYPMKDLNLYTLRRTYNQYETEGPVREDWEPFEWMKALESLVLIKLGGLDTNQNGWVKVPLLGDLFGHLFPYRTGSLQALL